MAELPRLAILSHVLPPAPSGQAVVLGRLLAAYPRDRYRLVSRNPRAESADFRVEVSRHAGVLGTLWQEARKLADWLRRERIQVLIAASGDLVDLPAAAMACRWSGVALVPYMFDDYLYQWVGRRRWFSRGAEPGVMRQAAFILAPNEFLGRVYEQRYGRVTHLLPNPCPLPDLAALDHEPSPFEARFRHLVYTGSIYHAQRDAFQNLIAALERLDRSEIRLHLFTSQSKAELEAEGIDGRFVIVHDHLEASAIPRYQRHADALFLPLAFHSPIPEVIHTSAPGKTGEYLAVGRPVLVHAPPGCFVTWYFREHGCGEVVEQADPALLAAALQRILDDPAHASRLGARARARAEADFELGRAQATFQRLLVEVGA